MMQETSNYIGNTNMKCTSDFKTALDDLELNDPVEPVPLILQIKWNLKQEYSNFQPGLYNHNLPSYERMLEVPSKLQSSEPRWYRIMGDNQVTENMH